MSIIKLIPGQRVALTVTSTAEVEGNYGPQIKFGGTTPDDSDAALYLNVDTAVQQLGRIGFTPDSVIGHAVEIERIEKNGRKFTNINRLDSVAATAGNKASTAKQPFSSGAPLPWEREETGAAPKADALPTDKLDHLFRIYSVIEDHILATSVPKFTKADVGTTPESVAAQIATLLIAAQKVGV